MNKNHQLFILRHGQAVPGDGNRDFGRALTTHGQLQVQAIGNWLAEHNLIPQHLIASAAHRARQTAELVCDQLSPVPSISIQANLYHAGVTDLIELITHQADNLKSIMIVGHNPILEDLLFSLLQLPNSPTIHLQSGSLAIVEINSNWSQLNRYACQLSQLVHANDLL